MKKERNKQPITNEDLARDIASLTKTVEKLAASTARGFAEVQETANERFKLIIDRFGRVEDDVTDIKRALGPLVQVMALDDKEMSEVKLRLTRVERKIGLAK